MAVRAKPELGLLRLVGQRLVGSVFTEPVAVVRWLLAMQAQDFPGAKWSCGLRAPGIVDGDVEAALTAGHIVRSWPMRGTLHLVAAEDLGWILALTTPRLVQGSTTRRAALELDDAQLERARSVATERLEGGRRLTREQLLRALDDAGIATAKQRGYHILWHLSQTGTLCFGPTQGKQHTFVLLDEWITRPRRLDRDESLGELARRYFESHGPAALRDFVGWAKLTLGDARKGLSIAQPALAELVVDGTSYWLAAATQDRLAQLNTQKRVAKSVLALPGFDEYVLGYQDRSAVLPEPYRDRIVPGGNGMFIASIVAGGQLVGTWRRTPKAKETVIDTLPFASLAPWVRQGFARAAGDYGKFISTVVRIAK